MSEKAINLRSLALNGQTLQYQLKRSARRTIGFRIDGDGLSITAPRRTTLIEIEAAIGAKQRWIFAKLNEWQTHARICAPLDWRDGMQIPYLGQPLTITFAPGPIAYDAARARLTLPAHAQPMQEHVRSWLRQEAMRLFGERLAFYADKLDVCYRSYALSSAATRWGSCSSNGMIRLNWRLIHCPLALIDYVVAHELAHLREMNHSPRFWQTVASIFPEFREARHRLKHLPAEWLPGF